MNFWAMWLMVVILLTILEFATVNLVSVWFIASGIVALILSLFVDSLVWQFGVFVVVGIILMILTKPMLNKITNKEVEKLNLERVIGMPGIVTQEIKPGRVGEVKVDGKLWSATSLEELPLDTMILVEKMEGVKLFVVNNEPKSLEVSQEVSEEVVPQDIIKTSLEAPLGEEKKNETLELNKEEISSDKPKKKANSTKKKKKGTSKKGSKK